MTREWLLVIQAPDEWLTANKGLSRWARAALVSTWRRTAYQSAQAAKLPQGLAFVHITPEARFPGRAPVRDAPNLAPTVKACIDGLGKPDRGRTAAGKPWIAPGYGLIPDDSDKHLTLDQIFIGPKWPLRYSLGVLALTIREVTQ